MKLIANPKKILALLVESKFQPVVGHTDKKQPVGNWGKNSCTTTTIPLTIENTKRIHDGEFAAGMIIPKGLFCIDIDNRKQLKPLQCALNKTRRKIGLQPIEILCITLTVKTQRGYHLYFQAGGLTKVDTSGLKNKSKALTEVDLRHDSTSYQVLPPTKFYPKKDKNTGDVLPESQQKSLAERGNYAFVDNGHTTPQPLPEGFPELLKKLRKKAGISKRKNNTTSLPGLKGKRLMHNATIETGLDALSLEHFPNHETHLPLLLAVCDASGGSMDAFKLFATWSRLDPLYDTDRDTETLLASWRGYDWGREDRYTYATFIKALRDHTDLPETFYETILLPEVRQEQNKAYHNERVERLVQVLRNENVN